MERIRDKKLVTVVEPISRFFVGQANNYYIKNLIMKPSGQKSINYLQLLAFYPSIKMMNNWKSIVKMFIML